MRKFVVRGLGALVAVAAGLLAAPVAQAQQGTITGKVTDEASGAPLAGARVQVVNQAAFALSNQDGAFTIRGVNPGALTLRIFMLGYRSGTREVTLAPGGSLTVDWQLRSAPFQLEEIVTTATGEQATRELGNSVSKISTEQLVETAPTSTLEQVLNGRVAGVQVLQSSGTTGTGARIRVRGISSVSLSNDPLLYIDGIRVAGDAPVGAFVGGGRVSKLADLNPEEIESIEIVKGPSAATLYGTQAANGVIRVTTKRGRSGAAQWNFWAEGGALKDDYTYPSTYFNASTSNANDDCLLYEEALGQCQVAQRHKLSILEDPGTTPFGTGYRQQLGGSVSGGSDLLRYFVSAEEEYERGLLKLSDVESQYLVDERGLSSVDEIPHNQRFPNKYNKYSFRVNLNSSPRSNLDLALSSGFVVNNVLLPQTGDNFQSVIGTGLFGSANPNIVSQTGGYGFSRPANSHGEESFRKGDHFINSATMNWRPTTWLSTRATFGLDYLAFADEQNVLNGQGCVTCGTERQGKRLLNRWTDTKYTVDLGATGTFQLGDRISSKTSVGAQYNHDKLFGVAATANILPPGIVSLSAGAQILLGEQTTDVITLGTYIEQQFGLDDRLYVTGALRVDDNSAFGSEFRSAYYPKVSGSFVALEPRDGFLSSLRLRAAYGATGQSPRPLDALTYSSPVTAAIFGQASVPGVTLGSLGDPNLKPERSREIEAGVDASLLNSRVNVEVTVYDKKTTDAMVLRTQPYSLGGVGSRLENVGVVSNKGIEVSVFARLLESRSVTWDLNLEASGNRNRLVSLDEGVPPIVGFGFKNIPGYPMFGLWWQGFHGFSDADGNGAIDPTEVMVSDTLEFLGSTVPTRTLSANTSMSLFENKLRVGAQFDYRGGHVTHNINDLFQCAFQVNCRQLHDPSATLEEQARAVAGPRAFGAYAENAEFIRLREASITYNAPNNVAGWFGARSMNISLTGRNIALWTFGFNSWDPENVTGSQDASNYNFVQQRAPLTGIFRINLAY
ncbi:MAG: SusC/RagA family TonB-linked outer membrane protein [Gemmatimonadales bacterium]